MLTSNLWITGEDYKPIGLARRLSLTRFYYKLPNDILQSEPRKGMQCGSASLRIPLSHCEDHDRHMSGLEKSLDSILDLLALEYRKFGDGITMSLHVGTIVGETKYYTRSIHFEASLLAKLAALSISLEVSACPCSE